jgi:nucleoside-diphosphate-sugar epimerase
MSRAIALTGATGFIGSILANRLVNAGWQIKALIRPTSARTRLSGLNLNWVEGDLEDLACLRRLVHNTDAVVHCAGAVRGVSEEQFNRVNVDGVARLVQAATEQHLLPRFLLISSLAARIPSLSPYAASKQRGENTLSRSAGKMPWTILRPPAVYGPGDRELLPLFRWALRGLAPVLGSDDARFSLLYVEDLTEAILQLLRHKNDKQNIFELHDGYMKGYSWKDVLETVARLNAKRVFCIPVPEITLRLLARLNLIAARLVGYAPMLTPGKVRELRYPDWVCDNTAIAREIGWKPRILLEEGLRRTLGWDSRQQTA